jgi:hypothetical protein
MPVTPPKARNAPIESTVVDKATFQYQIRLRARGTNDRFRTAPWPTSRGIPPFDQLLHSILGDTTQRDLLTLRDPPSVKLRDPPSVNLPRVASTLAREEA